MRNYCSIDRKWLPGQKVIPPGNQSDAHEKPWGVKIRKKEECPSFFVIDKPSVSIYRKLDFNTQQLGKGRWRHELCAFLLAECE